MNNDISLIVVGFENIVLLVCPEAPKMQPLDSPI